MSFNEFRDDVLLTLDHAPDSVLRRVKTFDKGVVLQIAASRHSRTGTPSWDGVKIIHPFEDAWIDRLLQQNFLKEETVGGEQVYVLVQRPPNAPELSEPPSSNTSTEVVLTPTGDVIVPFRQDEGLASALNALTKAPNADELANGDWPAGKDAKVATDGESDVPAKDGEVEQEAAAADLGEPKPAEPIAEEQSVPKPADPPPAKPSAETKAGKAKNK